VVNSVFRAAVAVLSPVLTGHDTEWWRENSLPISGIERWWSSHYM